MQRVKKVAELTTDESGKAELDNLVTGKTYG